MSTDTKSPDFAGIAKRLSLDFKKKLEVEKKMYGHASSPRAEGYASCMEAKLRSDWETIRLLRAVSHPPPCDFDLPFSPPIECTCGLSAHLSKLLEPFTP